MIKKPFSQSIVKHYAEENLETSSLVDYLHVDEKGLEISLFEDLPNKEIKGFPFSSDFVDEEGNAYNFSEYEKLKPEQKLGCKLRYFYLPKYHELYIGTTGSGKTTGCIEPQIRAISTQKNKPNIFITDPKGELFNHHATYLKNQSYRVYILNFKDVSRSQQWNPLDEIYETQQEILKLGKDYKEVQGTPDDSLDSYDHRDKFKDSYYLYKGIAFASVSSLDRYVETEKYMIQSRVSSLVNQLASTIMPDVPRGNSDPSWLNGARDFLKGILLCMADESINPEKNFTKKMMTLKTVNDIYAMLSAGLEDEDSADGRRKEKFLKDKPVIALNLMSTVLKTAPSTRKGFLSTFQSNIGQWMQGHIYQITADTTIDLRNDKKPFAIFIATRDYDKSDNVIAGLFIDYVYRTCLRFAEARIEKKQAIRQTHFLLDEFANIPRIPDFDNKIATARSRNIWFHLFIQSYDQLDVIYSKEVANIICDNCNEHVFLGSQSNTTKQRFSTECGKKAIKSAKNIINAKSEVELAEVPVVSVSDLDGINVGEMYIKRIYKDVIKGGYIRSYQAAEMGYFTDFYNTSPFRDIVPYNDTIPDDDDRTYFPAVPSWYKKKDGSPQDIDDEEEDDDFDFDFSKFRHKGDSD